ncbi:Fe-S cluster assembly protein HesB [Kibdelosporangium philippinense]|uniref:Fe-S cluster assembly protein HesB n=1 Tax=Kibdelosporangium philippinense TaxID=211113 RepID=A0ABS8ZDM9_9PSEU|nr:HhH-GPD-type base excision DNA repair protein [Kibdelosporangium philippinense]MCE7005939.1 Fe-S cluster assembly protein HesB [Kibdelosporangium philippinense]
MTRTLHLAGDPEADALLAKEPLALLIGMLLDQQIAMEVAFKGPQKLVDRLGKLDVHEIAEYDPEAFATLATTPPAIHRYGGSMAKRVQALCQFIVETYDGKADRIWKQGKPDGPEILKRLKALPGYGEQKAKIFLALLGKQFGLKAEGWREAAGAYGEEGSRRSIADVTDDTSLQEVRSFKKAAKAAAKS